MKERLILQSGDTLVQTGYSSRGPLGETETWTYDVVNNGGQVVGTVEHTDHVSINGLKHSERLIQRDISGSVIVNVRW